MLTHTQYVIALAIAIARATLDNVWALNPAFDPSSTAPHHPGARGSTLYLASNLQSTLGEAMDMATAIFPNKP